MDVVIEDDDSHHYSETEELSLLTLTAAHYGHSMRNLIIYAGQAACRLCQNDFFRDFVPSYERSMKRRFFFRATILFQSDDSFLE